MGVMHGSKNGVLRHDMCIMSISGKACDSEVV